MAQGLGRVHVEVRWVGGLDGPGELTDFLTANVVHLCGRVASALQVRIDSHGFQPIVAPHIKGLAPP
ncbi:hypothetical protein D3C85_1810360 [compost metagenome]